MGRCFVQARNSTHTCLPPALHVESGEQQHHLLVGDLCLTRSWQLRRWLIDSRDELTKERMADLDDAFKLYRCALSRPPAASVHVLVQFLLIWSGLI